MSKNNMSTLGKADIESAKSAIKTYEASAKSEFETLQNELQNLTASEFKGAAAEGYMVFFANKIKPVLTDNLTDSAESLTVVLQKMLDDIKTSLLDTVDNKLGEQNQNL